MSLSVKTDDSFDKSANSSETTPNPNNPTNCINPLDTMLEAVNNVNAKNQSNLANQVGSDDITIPSDGRLIIHVRIPETELVQACTYRTFSVTRLSTFERSWFANQVF